MDIGQVPRDLQMPYLRAIQKIPGDTAVEKLSWIGRLTVRQTSEDLEQLPAELLSILRVEIAVRKKRHEDITSALKCEDSAIINRALKASWFFDGSHKKIIDILYFREHLFPYVSVNVRTRIVLTLAHRLSGKDPIFAQQMFTAVSSVYDIQTAYPLIMACDEAFAYKMIVEKELVLPIEIANKIFCKNPDLIVRFLKLLKPHELNATERTPFAIGIDRYKSFLPKLIKKRLEAFVELCEIHETHPPNIILSNSRAEIFLKKAQQHLIKKPLLYIHILPLKKINEDLMESIFPDLLPAEISSFDTDTMLDYLKHYPRDKKYDLLRKSYKDKYCAELLDGAKNVTPALLQLLPAEERIKQARIKIEKQNLENIHCESTANYKTAWICYLPVNEVMPVIKIKINETPNESDRIDLILQMIYVCKINEDDDALSNTLKYFLNRHKNEDSWVFERIFNELLQIYDVPHLSDKQISLILDIVRLFYVKYRFVPEEILSAIIHFKLIHNMPIEELIGMFLENNRWYVNFNLLQEYPQYERQCLVTFANVIQEKSFKDLDEKRNNICHLVVAIYNFKDRCKKSCIKVEEITIRDYPWLMNAIVEVIRSKEDSWNVKDVLQKNELELYRSWFPETIMDIMSGAALALLKRDLQSILNNWEKYLADCMEYCHLKRVQHFVKATRWYKDLPIKFAERCANYIYDKSTDKISSSVVILAILLHGDSMTKLIDPLIPTETTVDTSHPNAKDNYMVVQNLPLSIRLSNPPVPLELVVRLCVGDYLSIAMMILTNVSRRTSLPKVTSVAQKLMSMRVSTRKHGIRLMYLVASTRELTDFLQKTWATESHHSVRQVLFIKFQNVFFRKPNPETWSLYSQTMSSLNLNDKNLLLDMSLSSEIPNEYVAKYLELWLKTIDDLEGMGLDVQTTNKYIANYLATLTASVFNLLSETFAENILRRFLFHIDTNVSEAARHITISYILSEDKDKQAARIKVFADVFHNAVTTYWNVPHPKKLRFYPVNKAVRLFMDDFVVNYVEKTCFNKFVKPEIIDNVQTIFLSVLSPRQDAKSYLLLVYAKKLQECTSTKTSLGLRLGQQLQELTDVFSSLLISFMAEVLKYFLSRVYKHSDLEEIKLNVVEGLVEAGNVNSCFMAVTLLPSTIQMKHVARYNRLIEKFREMEESIITVLYDYLNNTDLKTVD